MNYIHIRLLLAVVAILFVGNAQAQFSLKFTESDRLLKQSIEHYEYGHYQKSLDLVEQYLQKELLKTERTPQGAQDNLNTQTANFYRLLSAVGLKKDRALAELGLFLAETQYRAIQEYGYFKMAKLLFAQQSFAQAIPYYEKASINYLSNNEITQRNFELAYCYLLNNQLDKVNPLFASVKDVKGEYFSPGNYYHGVLSYYRGDYDAALSSFEAVQNQKQYKDIVPFYIAELNYFKGNKKKAMQQAAAYLKQPNAVYAGAMNQLVGQLHYEAGDYNLAQQYLTRYTNGGKTVRNDDYFRLGYIHYQKGELKEAIANFKKVENNGTELFAQSLYYLGKSFLKNGEKRNAFIVFKQAIATNQLNKLQEDVAFNVAKLSYDIDNDTKTEKELASFAKQFPKSKYYNDAIEMLTLLHIKSKNFEKASQSLRELGALSPIFQSVYQKVNYARGIQLLKSGNAALAIPFFTESKKYPVNENLVGLAEFWKTECHYRLGEYANALKSNYKFIDKPGSGNSSALMRNAFLTNAYIHMHTNDKERLKLAYANYLDTSNEISASMALSEMDSMKPNYVPSHVPFVEANPYVFIYQLPSQQVDFKYTPLPITPMAFNNSFKGNVAKRNYVKLGFGTMRNTQAELGYDLSDNIRKDLYLTLTHRAAKSGNYLQQASHNQARLIGKTNSRGLGVESALTLERNVYRPYGAQEAYLSDGMKNRFFDVNVLSRITPLINLIKGVETHATVGLGVYNISSIGGAWSGSELSAVVDVPFTKKVNEKTDVTMGIEAAVNQLVGAGAQADYKTTGSSFLILKPSIKKQLKGVDVSIGLYPAIAQKFHLLPNVNAMTYSALLNAKVGVGVESELVANSYKQLTQVNPFLGLVNLQQTKRTLYYAQLGGAIYTNLNYSIKVGGGQVKNLPLYINHAFSNRSFDVWYEERATMFSVQANVEYQLNYTTNAGIQVSYQPLLSKKLYETAYHYVPAQLNAFARHTLLNRLALRTDLFVRSGTQAFPSVNSQAQSLKGAVDLNLRGDYQLSTHWNAFLELNNLLNSQYNRWNQYPNYGTNLLAGFVYSFDKSLAGSKINTEIK